LNIGVVGLIINIIVFGCKCLVRGVVSLGGEPRYSFFVDTLINTPMYIISVVEPTAIECIRCHIYKPRINFIKNGPLKKLLKLCQLY
jgi:hypothetical protein